MPSKILDNRRSILTKKDIEKFKREAEITKHMWDPTYKAPIYEEKSKIKMKVLNLFRK